MSLPPPPEENSLTRVLRVGMQWRTQYGTAPMPVVATGAPLGPWAVTQLRTIDPASPRPAFIGGLTRFSMPEVAMYQEIHSRLRPFREGPDLDLRAFGLPIYLIDAANVFYGKPEAWDMQVIADAFKYRYTPPALGPRKERRRSRAAGFGPCIVVCSGESHEHVKTHYESVIETLRLFVEDVYPIFVCYLKIKRCSPALGPSPCLKRDEAEKGSDAQCSYLLGGKKWGPEHVFCEFDDVLLTRLHAHFAFHYDHVVAVSRDPHVLKDEDVVYKVSQALVELGDSVEFGLEFVEKLPWPGEPRWYAERHWDSI